MVRLFVYKKSPLLDLQSCAYTDFARGSFLFIDCYRNGG